MKTPVSLSSELEHLSAILRNSLLFIYQQDRFLRYTWVYHSPPCFQGHEILGKSDEDIWSQAEAHLLVGMKQAVMQTKDAQSVVVWHDCGDWQGYCLWSAAPLLEEGGGIAGVSGFAYPFGEHLPGEERANMLASLSRALTEKASDYTALLDFVTRLVAEMAGEACAVRVLPDGSRPQGMLAFHHNDPLTETELTSLFQEMPDEARLTIAKAISPVSQATRIENLMARPDLLDPLPEPVRALITSHPVHAVLVLPLSTALGLLGELVIWRSRSMDPYTAEDQVFWQEVADRAALAMENARLYAEEVHRNRQLTALHDASTALLSTLNLEELLVRILDSAQMAIPAAERGILYLVAPQTGRLEVAATSGFRDPRIRRTGHLENSHARRSMRERRPILIQNTRDEVPNHTAGKEVGARSAMFAPLAMGEEVLGTLSLSASTPEAFSEADLQMLVNFAATTTAALHNAMLHAELQKIAITDSLTGLYNRRGLLELGRHEVERFQRFGKPLSAIMLDIDNFKAVNDTHGHPVGDQVLRGLADRCRGLIRLVDILGRYGGEEFVILLPETDMFQASRVAERLRSAVEESPFETDQGPVAITVSLGIARARQALPDLETLIDQADAGLYLAKQKGRNRVEIGL